MCVCLYVCVWDFVIDVVLWSNNQSVKEKISNLGSQTCHRLAISNIGLNALVTSTANIYSLLLNQKEYLIEIWIWESKTLMINKILYLKTRICLLTLRWNFIGPKFVIFLKPDIEFSSYLIPVSKLMFVHFGPVIKHSIFAWFEIGGCKVQTAILIKQNCFL